MEVPREILPNHQRLSFIDLKKKDSKKHKYSNIVHVPLGHEGQIFLITNAL